MDYFLWKDSFNTGVLQIDEQHKLFLEYVNECCDAACNKKQKRITDATIYDLKTYAATHFYDEEYLMIEANYPDLWRHADLHSYFKRRVEELEKAQNEGNTNTVASLSAFLRQWFLNHILEEDKKFAAWLAKKR